jgi:NtrC-family two-component system response regulator AlgB
MNTTRSALIIDGDPGVRQSMRLCLEADDARLTTVGTYAGALEALDRSWFDVVFLDLWLQSESCLTVLPEILRRQSGIGVIVITAFCFIRKRGRSNETRHGRLPPETVHS